MKTNESERLRSLTNDWKINSLFLEPPEMVGIKPQTSDDNLTTTKTDKHFKSFSNQQNNSDNKIFDEQSVDEMSVTETYETEETSETSFRSSECVLINTPVDSMSTDTANKTKYEIRDLGDANGTVGISSNELIIKGPNEKDGLKRSFAEKKKEEEGFKSKKHKDYHSKKSKALSYGVCSKGSPLTDQPLPQNIDTFTVEDGKSSQTKILQMFNNREIKVPICHAQIIPEKQLASSTFSFVVKVDTGSINQFLTSNSEENKLFLSTVTGNNNQIVNMVTPTCSYDQTNNFLANTSEENNQKSNLKTIISESIIKLETVKTSARKPHPKFRKFKMSSISFETSNTSSSDISSTIYSKPIKTFTTNISEDDKQANNTIGTSDTTTISEFNLTTKKAQVVQPTRYLTPKTNHTSSEANNTFTYIASIIQPENIGTFSKTFSEDDKQTNSIIGTSVNTTMSEYTSITKKSKVGQLAKGHKPKTNWALSETSNTLSSNMSSIIYPEPNKTFSANISRGDKQTNNFAQNSATTILPDVSLNIKKVGRPRGRKPKCSYTSIEKNSSSINVGKNLSSIKNQYIAFTNYYETFLNNKIEINKRYKDLFSVQPKPPIGFQNYLMNKRTYILAGNANKRLVYTLTPPPPNLHDQLKQMFVKQEKERQILRVQHIIEKEKLVICVEQEILRVHGRIARVLANQPLPFSACIILNDKELMYNLITPKEEKDNSFVKFNDEGREFVSWLQEVDDKWEKIKESMLWRHRNEAESLYAVQKMDWRWKLVELKMCCYSLNTNIVKEHVSIVEVNKEFVIYQNENVE